MLIWDGKKEKGLSTLSLTVGNRPLSSYPVSECASARAIFYAHSKGEREIEQDPSMSSFRASARARGAPIFSSLFLRQLCFFSRWPQYRSSNLALAGGAHESASVSTWQHGYALGACICRKLGHSYSSFRCVVVLDFMKCFYTLGCIK